MSLSDAHKTTIKRHLGYHAVSQSFYPLIEGFAAIDSILSDLAATPETEIQAVAILDRLAALEARLDAEPATLGVIELEGDVRFRDTPPLDALWTEVKRWRTELSILIGIPMRRGSTAIVVT